jgi:protease-4
MKSFFSSFLGAFIGVILAIIVIVFIVLAAIPSEPTVHVESKSVLHIPLTQAVVERGNDNLPPIDLGPLGKQGGMGLNHIIESLDRAADDSRIEGVYLEMGALSASPATLFDIRGALEEFKASGKWIVAYGETMGQGAYYVASVADRVLLYPEGGMDFRGLGAELMFFKRMLDEQGIDVTILRGPDNKYKSAVEPFMYEEMSGPNRVQYEALLCDIWADMLAGISSSRNIPVDSLDAMASNLSAMMPSDAFAKGLVDRLTHRDEVMREMRDLIIGPTEESAATEEASNPEDESADEASEDDAPTNDYARKIDLEFIQLADYRKAGDADSDEEEEDDDVGYRGPHVAVVYAVGEIESGEGDDETIGSERIARALRKARTTKKVKAVVLRVNSPGGSALASDVIYRETQLLKEAGKPVVVSMGDLAASGGYYISCGADYIFANSGTITGSIGVFGMVPNVGPFLENEIGITTDRVGTNPHANMMSTFKAFDEVELAAINESITQVYNQFIRLVADGRGMDFDGVDSIAQGRVWTGKAALDLGLVDELGTLEDAVEYAASLAEQENYRIMTLPRMKDPIQELLNQTGSEVRAGLIQEELGPLYPAYEQAARVRDILTWHGAQARLPYELRIR